MKIAVLDDWHHIVDIATMPTYARLASKHDVTVSNDHVADVDVLAERLKDVEVLMPYRDRTAISAALIERLPRLQLIGVRGRVPNLDVAACTRLGVVVIGSGKQHRNDSTTTELALALMLMGLRDLPRQIDSMKAGKWQFGPGSVARGLTLGIYAYGRLGSDVAALGRALAMKVRVWGRGESLARATTDGYEVARGREAFFSESDVVSIHLPLVDGTWGIITEADLLMMKPTAMFINTSRAGLLAPGALLSALKKGRPGKAGLDVYDEEPITDVNHPLLKMPNVICTPHIGGLTRSHLAMQFEGMLGEIEKHLAGQPTHVVNPEALGKKK